VSMSRSLKPSQQSLKRPSVASAVWLLHLDPPLDALLHWNDFIPLNARDALVLVAWTAPLVLVYCGLGVLRNLRYNTSGDDEAATRERESPLQAAAQAAAIAGDHLQRANRTVIESSRNADRDEVRQVFAVSTFRDVCMFGMWLYGLVPAVVASVGGKIMVRAAVALPCSPPCCMLTARACAALNATHGALCATCGARFATNAKCVAQGPLGGVQYGGVLQKLAQVPLIALGCGAVIGLADLVKSEAQDAAGTGARREDPTQAISALFRLTGQNVDDKATIALSDIVMNTSELEGCGLHA
jgi:hypothetical protein